VRIARVPLRSGEHRTVLNRTVLKAWARREAVRPGRRGVLRMAVSQPSRMPVRRYPPVPVVVG